MIDKKLFFDNYRKKFGIIYQEQVEPLETLLKFMENDYRLKDKRHYWAYMLATTKHETGDTFLPVKEAYWLSENWRKKNLRYYPWYGRGYVQLTWEPNYKKASKLIGINFTSDPDLILRYEYSYNVMAHGMITGWFTGKSLRDYLDKEPRDLFKAFVKIVCMVRIE